MTTTDPSNANGGGKVAQVSTQASQVAGVAASRAGDVAGSAADEGRRLAGEAVSEARSLLETTKEQAWRHAEDQTDQLVGALGGLRDQAAALIDGRPEDAPQLVRPARDAVDRLDIVTRRLEQRGLGGSIEDLQGFARRRPGAFLIGAGVLGFAVGRLARAGKDSHDGADGSGQFDRPAATPPGLSAQPGPAVLPPPPPPDPALVDPAYADPAFADPAYADPTEEWGDEASLGLPATTPPTPSVMPSEYRTR